MNQHIEHLAQMATQDILGVPVLDQKRFAELIVKECMVIARAGLSPAVAEVIGDRFGVPENT
jgi:hypothetical protein